MKQKNSGVINVHKEKGYTSHDVVAIIRKIFREKTGHTGTLDPNATGVLPVCIGRTTKLADYFAAEDKDYTAEIVFGMRTDTCDIWGEDLGGDVLGGEDLGGAAPVAWASSPPLGGRPAPKPPQGSTAPLTPTLEGVKLIAESFLGEILQVPPMYSAVKVGGRKLYELARKGQVIERKARRVVIHGLNVRCESVAEGEKFFLDVSCSKGTYIRSLCADIGDALGCGAVMGDLVRTRSGRFSLGDALTIEEIKAMAERGEADKLIVPPDKLLPYPSACVTEAGLSKARNGNPLPSELVRCDGGGDNYWMYDPDGDLIGLFCEKNGVFRAEVML